MALLISLFIIALSLSVDAFSVSLSLATYGISKKKMLLFTLLVGIMHFFMPLFGNLLGDKIIIFLNINSKILLGIILLFLGVEMIIDNIRNEDKIYNLGLISITILAISVSIDSFTIGFGLSAINNNNILSCSIFSMTSSLITYLGFIIGNYSKKILTSYANYIGIILLIILGMLYIL